MRTPLVLAFLLTLSTSGVAQLRMHKLELKFKQVYEIAGTDILVVDTLIMHDSSRIVLNRLKRDNFIHAGVAIFKKGAVIDGKGVEGLPGRPGRPGHSPSTPCSDGDPGIPGSHGTNGGRGTNVSLYFSQLIISGKLFIEVSGGSGGNGAVGGIGGGGAPGTRICAGGSGGIGADGTSGGNGGVGGDVIFNAPRIPELRNMIGESIIVRNFGGDQGIGGEGGHGGSAGLSPSGNTNMEGKPGKKGLKGKDGQPGKQGAVRFQDK